MGLFFIVNFQGGVYAHPGIIPIIKRSGTGHGRVGQIEYLCCTSHRRGLAVMRDWRRMAGQGCGPPEGWSAPGIACLPACPRLLRCLWTAAALQLPEFEEAIAVDLVIEEAGATPMRLVESACAAKRRTDAGGDFYWCIFDVEHSRPHSYLDRAKNMATDNGVYLAISNHCFELWLILHHQNQTAHLSNDEAIRLRRERDDSDGKHLDGPVYKASRKGATRRAQSLRKKHLGDGTTFPEDNPASSLGQLILFIDEQTQVSSTSNEN